MTVCVAATCDDGNIIFCAADRMLTTGGGIQYEPEGAMKLRGIGNKIITMQAGSVSVHAELSAAFATALAPDNGIAARTIEEYARLYAFLWLARFQRIQEREVLGRRSMTMASYLANHSTMNGDVVRAIDQELAAFQLTEDQIVESIFTGKDVSGTHTFVVRDGHVSCHDIEGYAVIGSGYSVADSQFIFARHSPKTNPAKTAYTLHRAKRMAEQASGVGRQSDWYVIVGVASTLHDDLLKVLEELYKKDRKQEAKSFERAEAQIKKDIAKRTPVTVENETTISPVSTVLSRPSEQSAPVSSDSAPQPVPAPQSDLPGAPAQPQPGSSRAGLRPQRLRRPGPKLRSR